MMNPAVAVMIPTQSGPPSAVVKPNTTAAPMIPTPAAASESPTFLARAIAIWISPFRLREVSLASRGVEPQGQKSCRPWAFLDRSREEGGTYAFSRSRVPPVETPEAERNRRGLPIGAYTRKVAIPSIEGRAGAAEVASTHHIVAGRADG
jgi:hypothetical protein